VRRPLNAVAVTAGAVLFLSLLGAIRSGPALAQAAPSGGAAPAPGGPLMEKVIPQNPCAGATGTGTGMGTGTGAGTAAEYPLSSYTIDYGAGSFVDVSRKSVGTLTEMAFACVRWVVGVGLWLVAWAFSFGLADRLAAPMANVAQRYQAAFFVPLIGSALLISAAYAGIQIFRGRTGRGLGEFAASLLLVAMFGTWLLSAPLGFLQAALRVTARLSGAVASVALPAPPAGCSPAPGSYAIPGLDAAVAPLAGQIQEAFIDHPYDLLQWGTAVPAACAAHRDAVLAAGPGGNRDQIVAAMDRPPCTALYQFNREPSTERLAVAVLVLAASGILMASLGMVAATVVIAQVIAVALIAAMPFAALAAALPGAGRSIMWRWATALVRALATIVAMSAFLTFLLLAGDALLVSEQGQSLLVQMAVLNLVAILGFTLRHRVAQTGRQAASGIGRRMESLQPRFQQPPRTALRATAPPPAGVQAASAPGFQWGAGPADPLAARVASLVASSRERAGDTGPAWSR
jgi:hypothetical protein